MKCLIFEIVTCLIRVILIRSEDGNALLRKIRSDPNYKSAKLEPLTKIIYLNYVAANMKEPRYQVSKEVFVMVPIVIYTQKDFFLLNAINEKLEMFLSAGLIDHWSFENNFHREADNIEIPNVLTLEHLSGAFYILALGCVLGLFVFVFEWVCFLLKKKISVIRIIK